MPFLLAALWAQRNIAVVPLVTLPVAARAVASPSSARSDLSPGRLSRLNWAFGAVLVALAVTLAVQARNEANFDLDGYPVEAMEFVEEEGLLGSRLLTTDRWAGYVILRFWPEQQVFMDDRFDMYPRSVFDDYTEIADVGSEWAETLERRDVDVVVWDADAPLAQVLRESGGWRLDFEDDDTVVFRRDQTA